MFDTVSFGVLLESYLQLVVGRCEELLLNYLGTYLPNYCMYVLTLHTVLLLLMYHNPPVGGYRMPCPLAVNAQ
jgi:hypothetical protein